MREGGREGGRERDGECEGGREGEREQEKERRREGSNISLKCYLLVPWNTRQTLYVSVCSSEQQESG